MYNRLILVAGSGRSGTSLFSGILKALGCHIPQPEVAADDTNPKGFGEPQRVVEMHEKLLRRAGVETSDARPGAWAKAASVARDRDVQRDLEIWLRAEFRHGDHVVIKDPRLLWFIPLWSRAGETVAAPCFVTVLRHPLEVIKSKQTYYGGSWHPNARTAGWLNTMLYTERATRDHRRAFVRYDDLLSDAMLTLSKIDETLDLSLMARSTPQQMRAANGLTDPSLRRSTATWNGLGVDRRLVELAEDVWSLFDRTAGKEDVDDPELLADYDRLREQYLDLYTFAETTAQASVVAGRRGGGQNKGGSAAKLARPNAMKKLFRKVRRKTKRALHGLRERFGGAADDPTT
jgi:hypothetical protein